MNIHSTSRKKIAVIGGGVIGLTTSLVLSDDHDVDIIADKLGVQTDSWKATAIWHVYLVPETEQVLAWAQQSLEVFYKLAATEPETGIELVTGYELFRKGDQQTPSWAHIPKTFRMLSSNELDEFNKLDDSHLSKDEIAQLKANPVRWGYQIEAPVVSMQTYLTWLEAKTIKNVKNVIQKRISSFDQLGSKYDLIVNCSGIGARDLVGDQSFVPYKGQYFILRGGDNSPTTYIGDDDHPAGMAYMIPRSGEIMIGGSAEIGREDLELTLDWDETLRRAGLYVPWLRTRSKDDQIRPAVVGVRPARKNGVRLGIDTSICKVPVLHNYGHGGSGFSLSWGCAYTVKELV